MVLEKDKVAEDLRSTVENDHELILLLKKEIEELTSHALDVEDRLEVSQENYQESSEQLALHEKLSAQHGILKWIFFGVIGLVMMMVLILKIYLVIHLLVLFTGLSISKV